MIDPYRQPPGHKWDCPCDECQNCRERWVAKQPPLLVLDPRDADDAEANNE